MTECRESPDVRTGNVHASHRARGPHHVTKIINGELQVGSSPHADTNTRGSDV